MHIELIWRCLLALPGLLIPGLSGNGNGIHIQHATRGHVVQTPGATPAAGVKPTPRPTTTPKTTPVPSRTPVTTAKPSATLAPGGGELASEQICPGQADMAKTGSVLVCLTDYARKANGKPGIAGNSQLMAAAAAKDQDMRSCGYSHTACGRAFNYWMTNKGYTGSCTAENIAEGQQSPGEVFAAWMKSPGHRSNILNASYTDIGVAETAGSGGPLWVMELGGCK